MTAPSRIVLTFAILLSLSACSALGAGKANLDTHQGRQRYLFCNVYLDEACFGISAGEELRMSIPSDYIRYDVKLAGGLSGVVYFGSNPDVIDATLKQEFETCSEGSKVCSFATVSMPKSSIEAIYSGDRSHDSVHVLLSGISESNKMFANEFIENFRGCERINSSLKCRDSRIFRGL